MEGLRPDRDELDRFSHRQTKSKKITEPGKSKSNSRDGIIMFIAFILLGGCIFLGWGYLSQQAKLEAMQAELASATSFVNQSKLLMARFEGELNEADVEMQQSGSLVEKKLAFLDSEMRKLWGVSNDRNKTAIKSNQQKLAELENSLSKNAKLNKEQLAKIQKSQGALRDTVGEFERKIVQVESMVTVATSEISVTRELINDEINALKSALKVTDKHDLAIKDNAQAISSIDASRLQLNERIVSLEEKLNALRLDLNGTRGRLKENALRVQNDVVEVK